MSDLSRLKSSSCTQFNVIEFSHEWTIRNFSFCGKKTGESLASPLFSAGANGNNSKWCLTLYPNGRDEASKEYLSLFLYLISCDRKSVFVKYKFYLWNAKREKFEPIGNTSTGVTFEMNGTPGKGFPRIYKRDLVNALNGFLLDDDTLILRCEIRESLDTVSVSSEPNDHELYKLESGLANHLEMQFNQKKFSDVTLLVGDQEFPAHKFILAARSPVFAAMFEHDMLEQKQSRVTITDIAPIVVNEMLIFIYTDKSPNLENMSEDMLAVADKYNLLKLKRMCENVLYAKISANNAADFLSLADLHRAEMLKARAITLISSRTTELMDTLPWKNMLSENSNLVREAFLAIKRPRTD